MKIYSSIPLFLLLLSGCSPQVKTDDQSVKKITTITEYMVLNEDFNQPDTTRQQRSITKYDGDNNILEEMDFIGPTLNFVSGLIYKYDSNGKRIKEYSINKEHEVVSTSMLVYAENKCEKTASLPHGEKWTPVCDYYDSIGNVVRTVLYERDGKVWDDFYFKYNSANQQTERRGTSYGKPLPANFTYYDEKGNTSVRKTVDINGIETYFEKFIYEDFDKNGNWKIRKSIMDNKPYKVALQKVEYN